MLRLKCNSIFNLFSSYYSNRKTVMTFSTKSILFPCCFLLVFPAFACHFVPKEGHKLARQQVHYGKDQSFRQKQGLWELSQAKRLAKQQQSSHEQPSKQWSHLLAGGASSFDLPHHEIQHTSFYSSRYAHGIVPTTLITIMLLANIAVASQVSQTNQSEVCLNAVQFNGSPVAQYEQMCQVATSGMMHAPSNVIEASIKEKTSAYKYPNDECESENTRLPSKKVLKSRLDQIRDSSVYDFEVGYDYGGGFSYEEGSHFIEKFADQCISPAALADAFFDLLKDHYLKPNQKPFIANHDLYDCYRFYIKAHNELFAGTEKMRRVVDNPEQLFRLFYKDDALFYRALSAFNLRVDSEWKDYLAVLKRLYAKQ